MGAHGLHRAGRPAVRVVPVRQRALQMVPQARSSAPRAPFVVVVVALLAAGLLGLLVLNTVLAQDAFRLHALQLQGAVLASQELTLQRQVEARQAPGDLAARATALGLVAGGPPAFLRLSDGVVLGQPGPAGGPVAGPTPVPGPADPGAAQPVVAVAAPQPTAPANARQPLPRRTALPQVVLPPVVLPHPVLPHPVLPPPVLLHPVLPHLAPLPLGPTHVPPGSH